MRRQKSNPRTVNLVQSLYELSGTESSGFWKDIARRLEKPASSWAEVNLNQLNRVTKKGETILVPGKVLGFGQLDHDLEVYSFNASSSAITAITNAKGKYGKIEELVSKDPKAKGVRIIK